MKDEKVEYHCHIRLPDFIRASKSIEGKEFVIRIPSIAEAKEGFWVDNNLRYTQLGNNVFWIPASAVQFVKKVTL